MSTAADVEMKQADQTPAAPAPAAAAAGVNSDAKISTSADDKPTHQPAKPAAHAPTTESKSNRQAADDDGDSRMADVAQEADEEDSEEEEDDDSEEKSTGAPPPTAKKRKMKATATKAKAKPQPLAKEAKGGAAKAKKTKAAADSEEEEEEEAAEKPPAKKAKKSNDKQPAASGKVISAKKKPSAKEAAAAAAAAEKSEKAAAASSSTKKSTTKKSDSKPAAAAGAASSDADDTDKPRKPKLEFVAFPAFPKASVAKSAAGKGGDAEEEMTLPEWQPWQKRKKKPEGGDHAEDGKSTPQKKAKTATTTSKEPAPTSAEAIEAAKEKRRLEKEREKKRAQEAFDRLVPEAGMTSEQSFEQLVADVLLGGKPPAAEQKAELEAFRQWEIPYMAHFTWLFQKPLNLRPLEPQRLEQILLQPNHVLNESTFSELASKLLFSTRLHYAGTKYYRRGFTQMGRNQRVFQYDLLSEWMFWLVELWIEQWKRKVKEEQKQDADDEEGDDDGEDGATGGVGKKGGKRGRKTPSNDAEDESDDAGDNSDEDDEEKEAYNLHLVPERKWRVNTEELFGNVNPFADARKDEEEALEAAKAAAATAAAAAAAATPAASSSEATGAAGASSSSSSSSSSPATTASSSSVVAPRLPKRRKEFHEISLAHRCLILRLLCDFQLHVNPHYMSALKELESIDDQRMQPLGTDQSGKRYYFFKYPDYRIYVRGTADDLLCSHLAVTHQEEEEKARDKKQFELDVQLAVERLKQKQATADQKRRDEADLAEREKTTKKLAKKAATMDDDAPLSMLIAAPPAASTKPTPVSVTNGPASLADWTASTPTAAAANTPAAAATPSSSLERLSSPATATGAAPAVPAAAASSSAAAASTSTSTSQPSTNKTAVPAEVPTPGYPFRLRTEAEKKAADAYVRPIMWSPPASPPFSLVTHSPGQMKALIARLLLTSLTADGEVQPRNQHVADKIRAILDDLNEGRHRQVLEEESKGAGGKGKKERTEPKRVSDRLVGLEAQREEAERVRIARAEEDSRLRYTRRNKWLDRMSTRNVGKVRRAFEKFMGIHERKPKDDEDDEESKEDDSSAHPSSSDSETDDEAGGRTRRRASRGASKKKAKGGRSTRNHGQARKSLKELSETESEEDAGAPVTDEDDDGCTVCGTVHPPEDGSNPILLCDGCDLQYCLKCVPLERVPYGKFFCQECRAKNPKIR